MTEINFVVPSAGKLDSVFELVSPLFTQLKDFLKKEGCDPEFQKALLEKFDMAVDLAVAIDIPQVPNLVEALVDKFVAQYAKNTARKLVANFCD